VKDEIIYIGRIFDAIACWLTISLLIVGAVAAVFFQFGLSGILSEAIGDQVASAVATVLVVGCWLLFVVTGVETLAAAVIYVWQPERFWKKCHSINLGLIAFAMVWIGMQWSDLFPITIAAAVGLVLGALLARMKAHLWKGSHVALVLLAGFSGVVQMPGAKSYVLPLVGAIAIGIAAFLWIASRPRREAS
jgi:hypothetical protein